MQLGTLALFRLGNVGNPLLHSTRYWDDRTCFDDEAAGSGSTILLILKKYVIIRTAYLRNPTKSVKPDI